MEVSGLFSSHVPKGTRTHCNIQPERPADQIPYASGIPMWRNRFRDLGVCLHYVIIGLAAQLVGRAAEEIESEDHFCGLVTATTGPCLVDFRLGYKSVPCQQAPVVHN